MYAVFFFFYFFFPKNEDPTSLPWSSLLKKPQVCPSSFFLRTSRLCEMGFLDFPEVSLSFCQASVAFPPPVSFSGRFLSWSSSLPVGPRFRGAPLYDAALHDIFDPPRRKSPPPPSSSILLTVFPPILLTPSPPRRPNPFSLLKRTRLLPRGPFFLHPLLNNFSRSDRPFSFPPASK